MLLGVGGSAADENLFGSEILELRVMNKCVRHQPAIPSSPATDESFVCVCKTITERQHVNQTIKDIPKESIQRIGNNLRKRTTSRGWCQTCPIYCSFHSNREFVRTCGLFWRLQVATNGSYM